MVCGARCDAGDDRHHGEKTTMHNIFFNIFQIYLYIYIY